MPGKNSRVSRQLGQRLQAAEHVVDVAARKVGAAAAFEEQRVACHEPTVEQEALTAGSMAWRVQQLDLDAADAHLVAVFVCGELAQRDAGDTGDTLRFM